MKHVGRMKNNSAKVVVVYRTLPGDAYSCLVVGTQGLGDSYHDTLMSLVESDAGQQANELADVFAARRFPDGTVMLGYLHNNGHLVKVKTNMVLMTPDSKTQLPLDKLNEIIAEQKGVTVEDLAVSDGSKEKSSKKSSQVQPVVEAEEEILTPTGMRSKADKLFKEAQSLRRKADELDPPKSKSKKSLAPSQ